MRLLRFNPDIPQQNVIPWKLVFVDRLRQSALVGFFYGRAFLGWPLAALATPIEGFLVARFIFGWERARYQKAVLEQIPDVMAHDLPRGRRRHPIERGAAQRRAGSADTLAR